MSRLSRISRYLALAAAALVTAALGVVTLGVPAAFAQDSPVTLSPAFQDITIAKDESQKSFELKVINGSDTDVDYRLSALDFKSLNETGGVAFIGENPTKLEQKYGLASWLILETNQITIPAHGTTRVKVIIDNRESLSPGGHYGAVLLTRTNLPSATGADQVKLNQVLSSLLLVKKTGGEVYGFKLAGQQPNGDLWSLPDITTLRFQNTGNVHVVPRGAVKLVDPLGRVVKQGIINAESGNILPESFRRYESSLTDLGVVPVPGWYHLQVSYRYDGSDTLTIANYGFFWLGWLWVAVLIIVPIWIIISVRQVSRWLRRHRL
jgi:hypothetical protein